MSLSRPVSHIGGGGVFVILYNIYTRRFHVSLVFWLVDLKWCPRSVFWRVLALSERLAVRDVTKNIECLIPSPVQQAREFSG